ncbi:cadherin-23-like [Ylistrum balloti]|uniref:cadherin-23-like n=1 Tax=Ylistrum balloti TaxID=509963 RepID=UPI002905E704|nr:cadherin-23-like [Ylistrum balloti]
MKQSCIMFVHLLVIILTVLLLRIDASCTIGPAVSEKIASLNDTYVTQYILTSSSLTSSCCGVLSEVQIYPKRTGYIQFQIWRPVTTNQYLLVGEFRYLVSSVDVNDTVLISDEISVQPGDSIGWYSEAFDIIPYTTGSNEEDGTIVLHPSLDHAVGYQYTVDVGFTDGRTYAIQYTVGDGAAPTFTNLPASIDVYDHTVIGSSIFNVTFNDSNAAELSSLVMSVSFYEPYRGTPAIIIDLNTGQVTTASHQLHVGSVTLTLTLTDICGLSDTQTLTVNIINQPPVFSNLPSAVDLSETVTLETLLYTLSVSDPSHDPVTCAMTSSSPADAPFLVQLVPGTTDFGVYSRLMPHFDFLNINQYVLTIDCTDTKDTTPGYFTVNILPNTVPVFLNIPASVTIATTTQIGTVVYTVLAADNETNDLEFWIASCSSCWFTIADTGQVILTTPILTTTRTVYNIRIRVSDNDLTSTDTRLSIIISGVNNQPTINNLPLTLNILESVAIGTAIFTLDVTEHDTDDILNYVISYTPSSAAAKFRFDTSRKQLLLIQSLDFESGTIQYTIGFTVDDGSLSAGPSSLTLDILDDNEAPTFDSEMYYVTDSENRNIGYSLPSVGFTVTDPDSGDSVTYSIASGDPQERFTIDATSGILEFAVRYDIDYGTDQMPAVVNLTIRATDTGGLSATTLVQITLQDSNDNRPYFSSDTFEANIPNDYPVKSSIVSVIATDIDYTYNEIQYTLISGDIQYFAVNEEGWVYLIKSVAEFYNYTTLYVRVQAYSHGHNAYSNAYILVSPALGDSLFNHTGNILWFSACVVIVTLIVVLFAFMTYRYFRFGYACSPKKWTVKCNTLRLGWKSLKEKLQNGVYTCRAKWKAWKISKKTETQTTKPKKVRFSLEKEDMPNSHQHYCGIYDRLKRALFSSEKAKTSSPKSRGLYQKLISCLPSCKKPTERIQVAPVKPELPLPVNESYNWTPWRSQWNTSSAYNV